MKIADNVLKLVETRLLKNPLGEKLGLIVIYEADAPYTKKTFFAELKNSLWISLNKMSYPILVFIFGISSIGWLLAMFKFFIFICLFSGSILFLMEHKLLVDAYIILITLASLTLGCLWLFFDLPTELVLREVNDDIRVRVEAFILKEGFNNKDSIEVLENQFQKQKEISDQKINLFRNIFLGFYLLSAYFIGVGWNNGNPYNTFASFLLFDLLMVTVFYFFVESYVSLRNSTFYIVFTSINNLKLGIIKQAAPITTMPHILEAKTELTDNNLINASTPLKNAPSLVAEKVKRQSVKQK